MFKRLFALLCLTSALWGCGSDFDPPYRLTKARVLAIKAEPPGPGYGETATLTPLFYFPDPKLPDAGVTAVTRTTWSWCPLPGISSDGYQCPVDQTQWNAMVASFGLGEAPSLDLGDGDLGSFKNPFPAELLAYLCSNKARQADGADAGSATGGSSAMAALSQVFDCRYGFPVLVRMTAETTAGPIVAVVQLYLPLDATQPPNTNPVVGGIRIVKPEDLAAPLDEAGTAIVPRNLKVSMEMDLAEANAETYQGRLVDPDTMLFKRGPDGDYLLGPTLERLNVSWYAEVGSFGERGGERGNLTGFDPTATNADGSPVPFQVAREMIWKAPELFNDDRPTSLRTLNRFIVVVRDVRGGVAWTTAHIGLEEK